ncbi:hypothetical protein BDB00DRAFT_452373 [Zychaea mexicana]|uniref:uncharacterized protein n=1 Tax=Zychaea mexicana TaxID=64656 RepID=UPI0022FE59DC|nr:uncharacterized protein BDB00DRAFT_452373 [Zychaea mexicana]KAI9498523.1 hypothetical protein BDB00DRAFT_452373 [Zychaea mexicana]
MDSWDDTSDEEYAPITASAWGDQSATASTTPDNDEEASGPASWGDLVDPNFKLGANGLGGGNLHRKGKNYKPVDEQYILNQRLKIPNPSQKKRQHGHHLLLRRDVLLRQATTHGQAGRWLTCPFGRRRMLQKILHLQLLIIRNNNNVVGQTRLRAGTTRLQEPPFPTAGMHRSNSHNHSPNGSGSGKRMDGATVLCGTQSLMCPLAGVMNLSRNHQGYLYQPNAMCIQILVQFVLQT